MSTQPIFTHSNIHRDNHKQQKITSSWYSTKDPPDPKNSKRIVMSKQVWTLAIIFLQVASRNMQGGKGDWAVDEKGFPPPFRVLLWQGRQARGQGLLNSSPLLLWVSIIWPCHHYHCVPQQQIIHFWFNNHGCHCFHLHSIVLSERGC